MQDSCYFFSLKDKIQAILEATFAHSKNLASFVFLYKSLTNLMEFLQTEKSQFHSFVAAFLGGYLIWGNYNKVNEQVSESLMENIYRNIHVHIV